MTHLDEGGLQAYLDDELPGRDRAAAAEHLLTCAECRSALDDLKRAHRVFRESLALVDVRPPATRVPQALRRGLPGQAFLRAAMLVLFLAAAASAAVPGSPVREWIAEAVARPEPRPAPPPVVADPAPPTPEPARPEPAGLSVPATAGVAVAVEGFTGGTLRLVRTDGDRVAVSAAGGARDPVFRAAPGRIEVAGGVGGEVRIELPRSADEARVIVDGRTYAKQSGGELRVLVPGEAADGGVVWP